MKPVLLSKHPGDAKVAAVMMDPDAPLGEKADALLLGMTLELAAVLTDTRLIAGKGSLDAEALEGLGAEAGKRERFIAFAKDRLADYAKAVQDTETRADLAFLSILIGGAEQKNKRLMKKIGTMRR